MIDVKKYLGFIDEMIESLDLTEEKRADYISRRDSIVARYNNPCLNLSMLSEFSAGKSTIINKLIGINLLKTANLATTSIPTYIKNGKSTALRIIVTDTKDRTYDVTKPHQKKKLSELLGIALPEEQSLLISLLTSDELYSKHKITSVQDNIQSVSVDIPDGRTIKNLCIIDTPGVNPGSDYAVHHVERTVDILKNVADALIILFPSHQSYSQSFQDFLDDYAKDYIKDAVFVVTQMDLVDESEREEVITLVKCNLKNHYGIEHPKMMYCAAGKVGKDEEWTEQFEEFKTELFRYLTENRDKIVSLLLSELIKKLLTEINADLHTTNQRLEKSLNDLRTHSIPNLHEVLDEKYRKAKEDIYLKQQIGKSDLEQKSNPLSVKLKSTIESKLKSFNKRSQITAYVNDQMVKDIEKVCSDLGMVVTDAQSSIKRITEQARSEMKSSVVEYFGSIQNRDNYKRNTLMLSSENSINQRLSQEFLKMDIELSSSIEIASTAGGAIVAGAILTALGPVGWIIGGLIGLFGSDRLFVDTARNKVTDAVFPKVPSIISQAISDSKGAITKYTNKSVNYLDEIKGELIQSYSGLYEECLEEFESSKMELINTIKYNKRCIRRAEALLKELRHR